MGGCEIPLTDPYAVPLASNALTLTITPVPRSGLTSGARRGNGALRPWRWGVRVAGWGGAGGAAPPAEGPGGAGGPPRRHVAPPRGGPPPPPQGGEQSDRRAVTCPSRRAGRACPAGPASTPIGPGSGH